MNDIGPPPFEPELDNLRTPPYSREAEQSILGAILLDNRAMDQVGDMISAEDFYLAAHRVIFGSLAEMLEKGEAVDPVTLMEALEAKEELSSVGGPEYLAQLVSTVPTAAHAKAYAKVIQNKSILRELAGTATDIVERAYEPGVDAVLNLDQAEQEIFSIGERKNKERSGYSTVKNVITPVFERIDFLMERKESVTGVSSGYIELDKKLSGLQPSDLLILAGRPSMGKTALAMNMAANAALGHGKSVAVFSLEMSKEQLVLRLLASEAKVDSNLIRTGRLKPGEDYQKLVTAAGALSESKILIDDTPALTVMAMRAKARRMKREFDIDLIVVDYLQLMAASGKSDNRTQEISEISMGLKAIAKELNVPVLALSQLSRGVESRTDKRPLLSDLRESGSIEQDADVVMFVFREEYYKKEDPTLKGKAEVIVAKQRNGPIGDVTLTFLHEYTRFENFAHQDY